MQLSSDAAEKSCRETFKRWVDPERVRVPVPVPVKVKVKVKVKVHAEKTRRR
jgi:hypothetical protein